MTFSLKQAWRKVGIALVALFAFVTLVGSGAARAQTCGTTTWDLWAGQTKDVGSVTVSNDLTNLYITYTLDKPGATFGALHAWVGNDLLSVPSNRNGIPVPGQFPYKPDATGLTSYTITIPLVSLSIADVKTACPLSLFVVTHANVKYDDDGDGVIDGGDTAFGGDNPINVTEPGRWWYYSVYSVCCDFGPPPIEKCTTAYGKGGYVFTTDKKSNPEKLPSLNLTRNRWGWATNLASPGSITSPLWAGAGLNNTANGVNVGTVTIAWDGANATVTYNVVTGDLKEAHVYVGDSSPTTIAPGQYGHTAYLDSGTTTYSVTRPAVDADGGGIWVVAHSVACYGQ